MTTRHQQTEVRESITKQNRKNINGPQKMHRLGTFSKNILLEGLKFDSNQIRCIGTKRQSAIDVTHINVHDMITHSLKSLSPKPPPSVGFWCLRCYFRRDLLLRLQSVVLLPDQRGNYMVSIMLAIYFVVPYSISPMIEKRFIFYINPLYSGDP